MRVAAFERPTIDIVHFVEPGPAAGSDAAVAEKLRVALLDVGVDAGEFTVDVDADPIGERWKRLRSIKAGPGGKLVELPRHAFVQRGNIAGVFQAELHQTVPLLIADELVDVDLQSHF